MDLTLLTGALAQLLTILILDFKGDFVDVQKRLGHGRWDHYSTDDDFCLGCAPPSGCTNWLSWINEFTKNIAVHCGLKYGEATLAAVIRIAVTLMNPLMAHPLEWPSLRVIHQLLERLPTRLIAKKEEYKQAALQKIEYLLRISGGLFSAERGFDIQDHLVKAGRCAVIDCTRLSPVLAQIVVNLLALRLMFPLITKRLTSPRTNFVLAIDEADPFCSRDASAIYPDGYNELARCTKQGREFGVKVILGVGVMGRCSPFITSNITNYLIMNQSDPDSVARAAGVTLEPASDRLIGSLKRGEYIFKEAMGPVSYAMLAKADHVGPSDMVRPERFDRHSRTPARDIKDIPGLEEGLKRLCAKPKGVVPSPSRKPKAKALLTKNERAFLDHVSLHEFEPAHGIFARMGLLSPATQQKIIQRLVDLRFIDTARMRTSRTAIRLVLLKPPGWDHLNKESKYGATEGDIEHQHAVRWKQFSELRRGCEQCLCRAPVPGSAGLGDVLIRRTGTWHCAEVVIGCVSNICTHVRHCFVESDVIDTLTIITRVKSDWHKIEGMIRSDPNLAPFLRRIVWETVDQLVQEFWRS